MFTLRIMKTIDNKYNVVQGHLYLKSKYKYKIKTFRENAHKLNNNITRAKSNIFNIVSYNKFTYFFTQTISTNYSRKDFKHIIKKINNIVRNLRKTYKDESFYYVLIPEKHKDKENFHFHGFLSSGFGASSYVNDNGFLSLKCFDCIGFNSITEIKNYTACSKYITKYITKDLILNLNKGDRAYYCSQGLLRENLVNDLVITQIAPIHFDFKNEFVFKSLIDEKQYYNLIKNLDSISHINYYNNE